MEKGKGVKGVRKYGKLARGRQYLQYGAHISLVLPIFLLAMGGAILGFLGSLFAALGLAASLIAVVLGMETGSDVTAALIALLSCAGVTYISCKCLANASEEGSFLCPLPPPTENPLLSDEELLVRSSSPAE